LALLADSQSFLLSEPLDEATWLELKGLVLLNADLIKDQPDGLWSIGLITTHMPDHVE